MVGVAALMGYGLADRTGILYWRNYQRRLNGWVQRSATNPKF